MVQEISKPAQTTYWVAKNSSGDVIHVGVVEPNQVVTTPQDVLVGFTTKIGQIESIEEFTGPQPAYNYDYNEIEKIWEFLDEDLLYLPVASGMASPMLVLSSAVISPSPFVSTNFKSPGATSPIVL